MQEQHVNYMNHAIEQAQHSLAQGGIPIGSVIVYQDKIIGQGHNQRMQKGSAILHGEMDALENARRQPVTVYQQSILYTTLSPCAMCTGAILLYQIPTVVIGENVNFKGEEDLLHSKGVNVIVLQDKACINIMQRFIEQHPKLWHEDIGKNKGS